MNQNARVIEDFVVMNIRQMSQSTQVITERLIDETISEMRALMAPKYPTDQADHDQIRDRLLARYSVTMEVGVAVAAQHVPWLAEARRNKKIEDRYWDRYRRLIGQSFNEAVVQSLDRSTDQIVDYFGNPQFDAPFQRRGLIMGDVQSGKTSNYIGLCCKAADAGYRLIILLTGTIEHLRMQTQGRLDNGFVGFKTGGTNARQGPQAKRHCGVGMIDTQPQVQVLTTTDSDFTIDFAKQANIQLDGASVPTLLVTKKNKNNLGNIIKWITQSLPTNGKLNAPVLVIDDEADNASVNTAARDGETKMINGQIRELLLLSRRATYVGITATPFANAFIRHDTRDEMLDDDLFPKDFIYSLAPPSNYIGATRLFNSEPNSDSNCRHEFLPIDDAELWLPLKHKINTEVGPLPGTLRAAIYRFIVTIAVRDLRGIERESHRSMMVNVSRFTVTQNAVRDQIENLIEAIRRDVALYGEADRKFDALPTAAALRQAYTELKAHCEKANRDAAFPEWKEIRSELPRTLLNNGIMVNAVNSDNAVAKLTFENGERRIVVGGNSLSRGITLDGLCVSYFHRKPLAKDTLLQMGRWFGYRDKFDDLCSLYISEDARGLFADAAATSDELRELVAVMNSRKETPENFGMRVLHHPGRLAITARNKMRHAREFETTISFSGVLEETRRLNLVDVESNMSEVLALCAELDGKWQRDPNSNAWLAIKVPKATIADLVSRYRFHQHMFAFQATPVGRSPAAQMIADASITRPANGHEIVDMNYWDVAVVQGNADPIAIAGLPEHVSPRERNCTIPSGSKTLLVSGQRARLGERVDEGVGVERTLRRELEQKSPAKSTSGQSYRELRSRTIGRPLLLINFVRPKVDGATQPIPLLVAGLGLSFPFFDDIDSRNIIHYRINTVEQALLAQFDEEDGSDE